MKEIRLVLILSKIPLKQISFLLTLAKHLLWMLSLKLFDGQVVTVITIFIIWLTTEHFN